MPPFNVVSQFDVKKSALECTADKGKSGLDLAIDMRKSRLDYDGFMDLGSDRKNNPIESDDRKKKDRG